VEARVSAVRERPAPSGPRDIPSDDVGRLVGPGAWLLFALFAITISFQAIVLGGPPMRTPLGFLALALVLGAAALMAARSVAPLPVWRTWVVMIVPLLTVALIAGQQTFHDHPPGYEAWELGANNTLAFVLAIRGRIAAAWIAEALSIGTLCVWSVLVSGSPLYGISISYGQPVTLIAVTAFAIGLQRTARRILEFRAAERERAGREAMDAAARIGDESELSIVRDLAVTTLTEIAEGGSPDPAVVRSLEAALRDIIRGRSLAIEPLTGALREVRERGVDVVVLDDLPDVRPPETQVAPAELARASEWAASQILPSSARAITIRIAPGENVGSASVTVSLDGDSASELLLD
jgi:hypothetical protein